jgi:hypothetical protein
MADQNHTRLKNVLVSTSLVYLFHLQIRESLISYASRKRHGEGWGLGRHQNIPGYLTAWNSRARQLLCWFGSNNFLGTQPFRDFNRDMLAR